MIYIVSGKIESGKSSFLHKWIEDKENVGGILCLKDKYNTRHVFDIKSKDTFKIQTNKVDETTISIGRFHFLESAFKRANSIIEEALIDQDSGYIIVDELGKLELINKGLHDSGKLVIEKTKDNDKLHSILVVRTSLLQSVLSHYSITNYLTLK